ncbi:MFS transporter [Sphingosinicella sp. CPCC 101087]|uniref:MFS transporter n=1 Tax=Sphingosinicella sp. CPCC 101087 TaxID=2497754 RepID=UPI00101CC74A|nr:MFS transporter [Sphingosinicella sp. CPCC 101087]
MSGGVERPAKFARGRSALSDRAFLIYSFGNGCSSLGLWVQRLALGWLAWQLSHSELWVGAVAFALFGPILFLSPFFGVLVDRLEPLRTAAFINVLMGAWAALLAILSLTGLLDIWLLFAVSLCIGTTSAAYAPIRLSIIPSIVPRELLANAIGISSMIFNASRLIGPAVGGAVLVALPIAAAFLINAVSYLPLVYALAHVPRRPIPPRAHQPFFAQLREGFAHAGANRYIRLQLILTAWGALFGRSILEVLPVYADRFYLAGASGLAALSAAAGGGALLAAYLTSRLVLDSRQLQLGSILLGVVNALALLALPLWPGLWLGLLCIGVVGFGSTGSAVLSQTLVQTEVADSVRGRVSSLWGMASLGGSAFGGLVLGGMLYLLGISAATLATALAALLLPIAAWRTAWRAPHEAPVEVAEPVEDPSEPV